MQTTEAFAPFYDALSESGQTKLLGIDTKDVSSTFVQVCQLLKSNQPSLEPASKALLTHIENLHLNHLDKERAGAEQMTPISRQTGEALLLLLALRQPRGSVGNGTDVDENLKELCSFAYFADSFESNGAEYQLEHLLSEELSKEAADAHPSSGPCYTCLARQRSVLRVIANFSTAEVNEREEADEGEAEDSSEDEQGRAGVEDQESSAKAPEKFRLDTRLSAKLLDLYMATQHLHMRGPRSLSTGTYRAMIKRLAAKYAEVGGENHYGIEGLDGDSDMDISAV